MSKVWVLQHSECEDLGEIGPILRTYGLVPQYLPTYAGEPVPGNMGEAAALLLLGGPMGVYDSGRYPFLRDEMRLIEQALAQECPVLGICLGCQLMAAVLGAEVRQGAAKEIGWHRVRLSAEARTDPLWSGAPMAFTAFHWHGDIFDLPPNADSLASSDLTSHQAFRIGSAYGCLFHMEVTEKVIGEMVAAFADELGREQLDGNEILAQVSGFLPSLRQVGRTFFQNWSALVADTAASR